jgi:hypothetical protein
VVKEQLAAFLFTALLASASLLASAFGNLYSVYARFITEGATICITIRRICYVITATVVVISIAAAIILASLSPLIDGITWFIKYVLYLILVLVNATPMTISYRMFQDGRAPSATEISNMKVWSLYQHYINNRPMYVQQGRAIVSAIQVMLQKAAQTQPASATVSEDDIAVSFRAALLNDKNWTTYLAKKSHMTGPVNFVMTDTMARFIAWEHTLILPNETKLWFFHGSLLTFADYSRLVDNMSEAIMAESSSSDELHARLRELCLAWPQGYELAFACAVDAVTGMRRAFNDFAGKGIDPYEAERVEAWDLSPDVVQREQAVTAMANTFSLILNRRGLKIDPSWGDDREALGSRLVPPRLNFGGHASPSSASFSSRFTLRLAALLAGIG